MKILKFRTFVFILFILVSFGNLTAQTFILQNIPTEKKQFGLKFNKAFYSEELDMSTLSGVYDLSLNIPVSSRINIIAEVPYIYTSYEINYFPYIFKYDKGGLGNIFIGLQTRPEKAEESRSTISFGLFLPTADEKAVYNASLINYYYLQKYLPHTLGFYFNYAYHKIPEKGFHYGVEGGPNFFIPTRKGQGLSELFLHYGVNGGYQVENFLINAELVGIMIVSEDVDTFSDRFIHLLDFGFQWKGDVLSPRIFYEIYLKDELNDYINGMLGIGLMLSLN